MIIQETDSIVFYSEHDQAWRNSEGQPHREGGPAVIEADGTQEWYHKGKYHRLGGPAIIYFDGTKVWYHKGELHREGGPSVIFSDGRQYWCLNGSPATREEVER